MISLALKKTIELIAKKIIERKYLFSQVHRRIKKAVYEELDKQLQDDVLLEELTGIKKEKQGE